MLLKLCCCFGGRGDDNNNNSSQKRQPATSETSCLTCCCCPCLFRCRHRTSADPHVVKDEEETFDHETGTQASTPVISLAPPLNKYVLYKHCCSSVFAFQLVSYFTTTLFYSVHATSQIYPRLPCIALTFILSSDVHKMYITLQSSTPFIIQNIN